MTSLRYKVSAALFVSAYAAASALPASGVPADPTSEVLHKLEEKLSKQAAEAHVTGYSLAIVKDGKVVLAKGYGFRDATHKRPVTPDTLFAIGSSSKAFTAFTVEMEADAGKLKLSDPPRKYVPEFKLYDSEADKKISISDLLCHRSGLARTDFAWATGKLNSNDLLHVIAEAHPTAKLGEKFQYQNLMFMAAGLAVAKLESKPWTDVVNDRIFKPLNMQRTNTSITRTIADPDHSAGFVYDGDKKISNAVPMRDITCAAPAGAINSSAREMTHWLQLLLNNGSYNGKKLLSKSRFDDLFQKHMSAGPDMDYGYGWFLRKWRGHPIAEHGGNIDGFSAHVAIMQDQHIGFVLLSNADASSFPPAGIETVFSAFLGQATPAKVAEASSNAAKPQGPKVEPATEAGTYRLEVASMDLTVTWRDNSLHLTVPGQPEYKLEPESGRKYRLAGMAGFAVEFRQAKGKPTETEMALIQPNGTFVAVHSANPDAESATYSGPDKDLIGTYENETPHAEFPVTVKAGKVCFVVTGQPAYALKPIEGEKNRYHLGDLPDAFGVTVLRDAADKVIGMELKQPQGTLHLKRVVESATVINAEEVAAKAEQALGRISASDGATVLHTITDGVMESEGVKAEISDYVDPSGNSLELARYTAAGKPIAITRQFFDGSKGLAQSSMSPDHVFSHKEVSTVQLQIRDSWKKYFKSLAVKRTVKVGGEEAYVLVKTPIADGISPVTEYVSTKTYLLLKRESTLIVNSGALPVTETFDDYREVGGLKVAFKSTVMVMGKSRLCTMRSAVLEKTMPAHAFEPVKGGLIVK